MVLIKALNFIVKMFEELVYFVAYCIALLVRKAWQYRYLLAFYGFMALVIIGGLIVYLSKVS